MPHCQFMHFFFCKLGVVALCICLLTLLFCLYPISYMGTLMGEAWRVCLSRCLARWCSLTQPHYFVATNARPHYFVAANTRPHSFVAENNQPHSFVATNTQPQSSLQLMLDLTLSLQQMLNLNLSLQRIINLTLSMRFA